ncbi:UMP-CMP kinase [Tricholoma matsutake]|nr:UMP-CMP kinase [Tricholoma matsutake 945]
MVSVVNSIPPVFDRKSVIVIFVLGGPGAGKGTQCARLVNEFGFSHLSAGDLLRAEQHRQGSEYGDLIQTCIRQGTIVPMEVTIKLLENAMNSAMNEGKSGDGWENGRGRFLIDGFPRKMDQAVCLSSIVLFFSTTEEIMLRRLLERGKTSGREDDNTESIKKRFNTYKRDTMPVIEHYKALGKLAEIDCSGSVERVYELTRAAVRGVISEHYDAV